jgi:hypothetical protein
MMKSFIYLFLVVGFVEFVTAPVLAQTQDRRMIFDSRECYETAAERKEEDSECLVELVDVHIAGQKITSGKMFVADATWLENLKVKVKNVSGKSIVYVSVTFELIEGLYESPPMGSFRPIFFFDRGNVSDPKDEKREISKNVVLKPNEEIELNFTDLPDFGKSALMQRVGKIGQIVMSDAVVEFEDGKQVRSDLLIK